MATRNALLACLLVFGSTPIALRREECVVIAAAIAGRFPDRSKPLLVARKLLAAHWTPRAARPETPHDLLSVDLSRRIEMVPFSPYTASSQRVLVLTAPEIVGDDAFVETFIVVQNDTRRVDASLARRGNDWIVTNQMEEHVSLLAGLSERFNDGD